MTPKGVIISDTLWCFSVGGRRQQRFKNRSMGVTPDIQSAFRALADPTRRQILVHLSQRDMTIAQIVDEFPVSRNAVKKHLTALEEGQLIRVESRGRERLNKLEPVGLKFVADWFKYFDHFWDEKLNSLKQVIEQSEKQ